MYNKNSIVTYQVGMYTVFATILGKNGYYKKSYKNNINNNNN